MRTFAEIEREVTASCDPTAAGRRVRLIEGLYEEKRAIYSEMQAINERLKQNETEEDLKAFEDAEKRFVEIENQHQRLEREDSLRAAETHFGNNRSRDKRNHLFATPDGRRLQTRSWDQPLADSYGRREDLGRDEDVNVGRFFRGMVLNDYSELSEFEQRTLLGGSDTGGGYLLPSRISAQVIDLARSASVSMRAGAQTLPMDTAEMKIIRQVTDPTMQWRPEGSTVTASEPTFDAVTLRAKTVACIVPLSVEILEDAANIEQVVNNAIRGAFGLAMDQAILFGEGVSDPLGLRNLGSLNEITSVGLPTNYDEVSNAVGDVRLANFMGDNEDLAWIRHPTIGDIYSNLKTGISNDNTPLPIPQRVSELQLYETTSIATDEGAGSDEQFMFVGDFSQVVVGMRTNMMVRVATDGSVGNINATSDLVRFLVMHARLDVAVVRPTWLTLLSGVQLS